MENGTRFGQKNGQTESNNSGVPLSELAPGRTYFAVFEGPRHHFQEVVQVIKKDPEAGVVNLLNSRLGLPFELPYRAFLPTSPARVIFQEVGKFEVDHAGTEMYDDMLFPNGHK